MNIVYVAPFLRVPPDSGGAIRAFNLINCLSRRHNVSVVTYETPEKNELPKWSSTHLASLTMLPAATRSASSRGRAATLRRMAAFPPESFQHYPLSQLICAVDEQFERQPKPDWIIFDTLLTGHVMLKKRWPVPTVLSLYDVASDFYRRIFASTNWRPYKLVHGVEWLKFRWYEARIVRTFKLVVTVSRNDSAAIKRMHHGARVICVPNGVDTGALTPAGSPRGNGVLFIGNWIYAPNADGLWHFYENIWPRIRSRLDAQFLVVGRHPPASFAKAVRQDSSVRIAADVPDVRPYYAQARVSVVPLLNGEGTRLKILEAFALGVPVVSTTVGCEGLDVTNGETLIVADDPQRFAEAVVDLFHDPSRSKAVAGNARALAESRYDWEVVTRDLQAELSSLSRQV
ncbi:MAG: glycosyltransferase family 4 protein [Chloroflexi bacterium]|nr:glycosyltransferase family 4 protein [Chloroflexota bacterium]